MRIGIGLGSNVGNRLQNLERAVNSIARLHHQLSNPLTSPVYVTQPVDCKIDTRDFYNMAIELNCELPPAELLTQLWGIESSLGRPSHRQRNAPRTIDLDILYADNQVLKSEKLTLPHPRLTQRRFVLQPLADIRPELVLPGQSKDIATLLADLDSDETPLEQVATAPQTSFLNTAC